MQSALVFGEVFSENVGDGIIFQCIANRLSSYGVKAIPADLALRTDFGGESAVEVGTEPRILRRIARFFVRRSIFLRRMITLINWRLRQRSRFLERFGPMIADCDAVIIGGGQILVDRQWGFPLRLRAVVEMAVAADKPIAIFACGADLRHGPIVRRIYRYVMRNAAYISVRDRASAKALSSIDPKSAVDVHPDVGFLISDVYAFRATPPKGSLGINIMPYATVAAFRAGLKPVSVTHYTAFWVEFVSSAIKRGWRVTLMTNGDRDDYLAARDISLAFQGNQLVQLARPPANPEELVEALSLVEVLVTARMHAGIVAYSLGKHVVPLVWDEKVSGVWLEADPEIVALGFEEITNGSAVISRIFSVIDRGNGLEGEKRRSKNNKRNIEKIDRSFNAMITKIL